MAGAWRGGLVIQRSVRDNVPYQGLDGLAPLEFRAEVVEGGPILGEVLITAGDDSWADR